MSAVLTERSVEFLRDLIAFPTISTDSNLAMIDYLARKLPPPGAHKLWFDHGTETVDALYEPYQQRADAVLRTAGYTPGPLWQSRKYPGTAHNEIAWRGRVHEILAFLLNS